jgi:two-component system response regulator RpaA
VPSTPPGKASGTRRIFRALLVDDLDDNRDLYSSYLRHWGWQVEDVADGAEAVAIAAVFEPHVIVMDVAMREMSGIEAMQWLRRDSRTRNVPIVVLTAYARYEAEALGEGCAEFVTKPCTPAQLLAILRRVLAEHRSSSPVESA